MDNGRHVASSSAAGGLKNDLTLAGHSPPVKNDCMVQSKAVSVDDYMASVSPLRASAMAKIRASALRNLPDHAESMRYGMPTYSRGDDAPGFAFNSQKQYISLYLSPSVNTLNAEALKGLDAGKSCIRFRKPEQIDFALLDRLLADTSRLGETIG